MEEVVFEDTGITVGILSDQATTFVKKSTLELNRKIKKMQLKKVEKVKTYFTPWCYCGIEIEEIQCLGDEWRWDTVNSKFVEFDF